MNKIKVPWMPIDEFDGSKIAEKFSEASQAEIMEIVNMNSKCSNGEKLSESILLILHGIGMEKYIDLFEKENVSFETFLQLNESDLEEIGISNKEDRILIAKNLSFHKTSTNNFTISENHTEDLQIVKNISHELLLLENYCTYLNLQMKKQKLMDYRINTKESACTYLKAFAECALIQSQILSCRIYDVSGSEALIDKLLKANNLTLPKALQELLPKKRKKRSKMLKVLIIIGFSSFIVISGKYLIKKCLFTSIFASSNVFFVDKKRTFDIAAEIALFLYNSCNNNFSSCEKAVLK